MHLHFDVHMHVWAAAAAEEAFLVFLYLYCDLCISICMFMCTVHVWAAAVEEACISVFALEFVHLHFHMYVQFYRFVQQQQQ